jgi:hypothetical protein
VLHVEDLVAGFVIGLEGSVHEGLLASPRGAPRILPANTVRDVSPVYCWCNSQCPSSLTVLLRRLCGPDNIEINFWRFRLWEQGIKTKLWWC